MSADSKVRDILKNLYVVNLFKKLVPHIHIDKYETFINAIFFVYIYRLFNTLWRKNHLYMLINTEVIDFLKYLYIVNLRTKLISYIYIDNYDTFICAIFLWENKSNLTLYKKKILWKYQQKTKLLIS